MATKSEYITSLMSTYPYGSLNRMTSGETIILSNAEHDKTVDEWATANAASDANATMTEDGGAAVAYAQFRTDPQSGYGYKQIKDQLDQLYHDVDTGKFGADAKTGTWYVAVKAVKDKYTKPA